MSFTIHRQRFGISLWASAAMLWLTASACLAGDTVSRQDADLFEIHVRPVLVGHCIKCHGDTKQEGALRLTKLEELLRGGDSGPAIVPGQPSESLMLEALRYESYEMPPDGQLKSELIAGIEKWIAAGAPWPKGVVLKPVSSITEADREWWCIQPIRDPEVPVVDDHGWGRNEIDRFIFARLAQDGIRPSEPADPRVLARRLHFAVTGLPPESTPVPPTSATWLDDLVDELLDSPAYGENQARFWLDLVRYADSDGYNADHRRPDAVQYRDYVVRSFNADKPYDRFVTEQIAGDEVDPGSRDALVATMYLRHWIYEWNQRDVEGQWAEILSDVTETTSDVFLGLSLKCARCHDHKFDPLLHKDYYRLQAFFAPLQPREDLPLADLATRTAHYRQQQVWEQATEEIRRRLHEIEQPVLLKHSTREGVDKFVAEIRTMISKRVVDRTPYQHQIASMAARQFDLHPDKLPQWLDDAARAERQALLERLAEFDHLKPEPLPTLKFVASDVGPVAPPTFIPDVESHTPIEPGFPTIIDDRPATIIPPPEALQSTGRRTALARWLTDPTNPLVARVLVNRIWAQHFGRGLVESVNDFGHLGTPPSHPELLDWLATRFIEDGWSIKKLHRRILTSATWQQRSDRPVNDSLSQLDPNNTLLWRMNPRRLAAEEIVDAMLAASGELGTQQRALYRSVRRNYPDPQLGLFDFPDRIRSQGQRHHTTTAPQALMLMNNTWSHERAAALASQLAALDDEALLRTAYARLYYREPDRDELAAGQKFLAAYESVTPKLPAPKILAALPDGRAAIDLKPAQPASVQIPSVANRTYGDFTVEATVLLRSLYPDASVRTIATTWTGDQKRSGWSLGVTSTKSAYKPRNLILQLVGTGDGGGLTYEVVASNLRLELDKPYHVAVAVDLEDTSAKGVTFFVKDLSKKGAEFQVAHATHKVTGGLRPEYALQIGGRLKGHLWDGLLHNVRLHDAARNAEQLTGDKNDQLVLDAQFTSEDRPGADASGHNHHAVVASSRKTVATPQRRARTALLHALLNSNEMIYVD